MCSVYSNEVLVFEKGFYKCLELLDVPTASPRCPRSVRPALRTSLRASPSRAIGIIIYVLRQQECGGAS